MLTQAAHAPLRRTRAKPRKWARLCLLLCISVAGCRCTGLASESDGQRYLRCGQADAPAARQQRVGRLTVELKERSLAISAALPLRVAAFSGPVGTALDSADLALLRAARPELVFYLGGLGDDVAVAQKNLSSLAALRVPTLFVAGGEDRWPVVEAAFAALSDSEREVVFSASGLRELRIGRDRFVVAAGAPFGRYARDDESCGFQAADLEDIQAAAAKGEPALRTWLLSWHAPAGFGVSDGLASTELGSPDLQALALAVGAKGGLFAFPESQAGRARATEPLSLVVPRLGRLGSQRADGSRLPAQVAQLILTADGLLDSSHAGPKARFDTP